MIFLNSTTDKLQVVTGTAVNVDVHASYVDLLSGTVTPGRTNTKITTATTTDVVGSPAASTTRNIKTLLVNNVHASSSVLITVQHTDGTNVVRLQQVTLLAGESITYREGGEMTVVTAAGIEKTAAALRGLGSANTATITANAADTYMTGASMNVDGRLQAGSHFRWQIRASKTGAGTATPLYNIRFGTTGTVSDTARVVVTGVNQTAVADTGLFFVEAVVQTYSSSGILRANATVVHQAAQTGFANLTSPSATNVSSAFDMTVANSIIGLSIHPGTAGVWTIETVTLVAGNLLA